MTYQFVQKGKGTLEAIDRNSVTIINYYSKSEMKELYPKEDFEVIGEIGNYDKKYPKQDEIVTESGKRIPIFPRGSIKKPFEWVNGYAAVGEHIYVAVVMSTFWFLLYNKSNPK